MKRFTIVFVLAVAAILAGAVWGLAQMGRMSNSGNNTANTASKDLSTQMNNMDNQYHVISAEYDTLNQNYKRMMAMNNMGQLHKAMQRYRLMMSSMANDMMQQGDMWNRAMSMMGSMGMMSGGAQNTAKSTGQSDFPQMMDNMNNHYKMMSRSFDSLNQNYGTMMQMNNMTRLKSAMQQHYQMMNAWHTNMMSQGNMWHRMMSMMQSGMMGPGMMGSGMSGGMMGGMMRGYYSDDSAAQNSPPRR
jgi:regulator of replication initiation timing